MEVKMNGGIFIPQNFQMSIREAFMELGLQVKNCLNNSTNGKIYFS